MRYQELVLPNTPLPPAMILLDQQRFLLVGEEEHCVHLDIYGFGGLQDPSGPGVAKLLVRFSMDPYRSNPAVNLELRSILARPDPEYLDINASWETQTLHGGSSDWVASTIASIRPAGWRIPNRGGDCGVLTQRGIAKDG
jgi:hypothetical protein